MKPVQIAVRTVAAVALAFFMSSASCDILGKADDVSFDVVLEQTFAIDEKAVNSGDTPYSKYLVLDAATINSDFDKYKKQFKSITVTSVTYTVSDYDAGGKVVTFKNGMSGFSSAEVKTVPSIGLVSLAFENIQAAVGQEKPLNLDQAGLNTLADLLKNDFKANTWAKGTFSSTPVKFNVKFKVKATIVANAL